MDITAIGPMDIAQLATVQAATKTQNDVGVAVLSKALDNQQMTGQNIVNMIDAASMERSVYPNLGGNFDMSV